MKKTLLLTLLAMAACVFVVRATASHADGGLDALISHYKCYQARHAKGSPRFQPQTVFLTDQFRHNIETSVIKLTGFCSRADQQAESTGSVASIPVDLTCYTVRDAPRQPRFRSQNVEVSDKLSAGYQVLTLSKVQSFCAPAVKYAESASMEGHGFICYQAKTAKGQPRFQQRTAFVVDQFDSKDVRVIRPVAFCTETEKKVDAPGDDLGEATNITELPLVVGVYTDHVSTVHATLENTDPITRCKTDYTNSVWYHWYSGTNKSLVIRTTGTTYDTVVAAFTGSPGSFQEVGCNDDADPCSALIAGQAAGQCSCANGLAGPSLCGSTTDSLLQIDALANTDYYILVGSSDGHGGKLKFTVATKSDGPDSCSNVSSPIGALTYIGQSFLGAHVSTMNASPDLAGSPGCPSDAPVVCSKTPEHTVWFNYRVPVGYHQQVNFDASTSSYDTVVAVYSSVPSLVGCGNGSVTVNLTSGQLYHIMVGDVDDEQEGGKLKLWLTLVDQIQAAGEGATAAAPPNSMVCYQVRQARHRSEIENVEDQFSVRQIHTKGPGFWTLTVGGVNSLCVPSVKEVPCSQGVGGELEAAAPPQSQC